MANLVRGMEIHSILEKLREEFPEVKFANRDDHDSYVFLPYIAFFERLEDVLSSANYELKVFNVKYIQVSNSHELLGDATFNILYDDGSVAISRSFPCGADIIVTNNSGTCSNFSNNTERLYQNALSKACKILGIGVDQLKSKRNNKKGLTSFSCQPESAFYVTVVEKFISLKSNGYRGKVTVEELNGEQRELVIWKEGVSAIEQTIKMAKFCELAKAGSHFHIIGYENEFKGSKQIILTQMST